MPINVVCPQCQKTLRVGDHVAGKKIRCPACQGVVAVPAEEIIDVAEIYEESSPNPKLSEEPRRQQSASRPEPRRKQTRGQSANSQNASSLHAKLPLRKPQKSRDYVHVQCRGVTTIDGPEFQAIADPLTRMKTTYCSECDEVFPIDEFAWDDTQERISDYYARYQQQASGLQKFLASRTGMFTISGIVFFLGLASCIVLGIFGLLVAIAGAIVAIVVHVVSIGPMILRQVLGTNDPTRLT